MLVSLLGVQTRGTGGDAHGDGEDERGQSGGEHTEQTDRRPETWSDSTAKIAGWLLILGQLAENVADTLAVCEE